MEILYKIHSIFGEMVLPVLILLAAIILTATWKADAPRSPIARFFPILIDIQATLGILWFIVLLMNGDGARLLSMPLILHPIIGLLAAGVGHMAVSPKGPFSGLGRWSALVGLAVILVMVVVNALIARAA